MSPEKFNPFIQEATAQKNQEGVNRAMEVVGEVVEYQQMLENIKKKSVEFSHNGAIDLLEDESFRNAVAKEMTAKHGGSGSIDFDYIVKRGSVYGPLIDKLADLSGQIIEEQRYNDGGLGTDKELKNIENHLSATGVDILTLWNSLVEVIESKMSDRANA